MPTVPHFAFSHIGINVTDIARMEAFYARRLGFTVTDRGELDTPRGRVMLVFLSRDPTEHHQIVLATGRPVDAGFNTINQMSFRAASLAELRGIHERLVEGAEAGDVSEIQPACHGNALSIYARDPEGNRLELFIDTPWYVNQPLRVPFGFERSDAQIWAWAEQLARGQPGFRPREQWVAEMRQLMGLEQ